MRSYAITSLERFRDERDRYESLRQECHAPIFSSYDLVHVWLHNFRSAVRPLIIMVEDQGELVAAAPMCTYSHRAMGLPITTISMVGNHRHLPGYSLLCAFAREPGMEVSRQMLAQIRKARWNLLQIFDLEPNPATLALLQAVREQMPWQAYLRREDMQYDFPSEGDIAGNFGARTRKNINTVRRRLEREGRMSFRTVQGVEAAEEAMRLYLRQHSERWDAKGGSVFRDELKGRLLVEMGKLAAARGNGAVHELLIDGEVAGQNLSFFDGDVSRAYRLGMTDKFYDLSPGRLTMVMAMEDHRHRGMRAMDFLHGDEEYKLHMTTTRRRLEAVQVLRGSLQALSRVRNLPPVRAMDERIKLRDRVLKRVYTG